MPRKPIRTRIAEAWRAIKGTPAPNTRVFAAAQYSRLTGDWYTSLISADQELKGDARRLRGAARSLVRDNSYAARFVNFLAENVVGDCGIRLQSRISTTRGTIGGINAKVEEAWAKWCEPENCTVDGRLSFDEVQRLEIASLPQDGEVLIRMVRGADNAFGFALQVLDPDLLDDELTIDAAQAPNGNEIRMGVEVDRWMKPVAYWLWSHHPSELGKSGAKRERVRVPAEEIIHEYIVKRPGQTRGVTWFAPIMLDQKMLQGYQEAEITAARIGASNMAAVTIDPEKWAGGDDTLPGYAEIPMEVEPGRFMRLGPGEALQATSFDHPASAFDSFTKSILRSISAGLNVSYLTLSGDVSAANYSSMRAGALPEQEHLRVLQMWVVRKICRRVYRAWVQMAQLTGHLPARPEGAYDAVKWQPPGFPWVDPQSDLQANEIAVKNGWKTNAQVCGEMGGDYEENLEQLKAEADLRKQYGIESPDEIAAKQAELKAKSQDKNPNDKTNGGDQSASETDEDDADRGRRLRLARSLG